MSAGLDVDIVLCRSHYVSGMCIRVKPLVVFVLRQLTRHSHVHEGVGHMILLYVVALLPHQGPTDFSGAAWRPGAKKVGRVFYMLAVRHVVLSLHQVEYSGEDLCEQEFAGQKACARLSALFFLCC